MKGRAHIGIDNGQSGTIGIITPEYSRFFKTPTVKELNFQKSRVSFIKRLDHKRFAALLPRDDLDPLNTLVLLERPFSNATRYVASVNALRCWEATLVILDQLGFKREFVDSKAWQSMLLPKGTTGSDALKEASMHVGLRLFPEHKNLIKKHKDADGLLIAEWARRSNL